ncbi:trypsin-like peptidase domain-containing protein [Desulfosporosinus youngiae]|uniref:Trypsin-like serine protease with C-terminal PDZ domain n=1 Tax=Desulfosporosinus youngiae DSM 17734 TaxID=768710 RepID=H5Y5A6_9FIRM|nr:hypothetical protein [Desulfosporosinus youngiae]EHQ90356.1 hypothetical protein DesyoDRAFT_3327 [Desulfosporosinus youngiae DSM 17734]
MNNKNKKSLMALPQVIGVGQGLKEIGGVTTEQKAIIVLVKRKLPLDQLKKHQLVPKTLNGTVTDVIEVGDMQAFSAGNPAYAILSYPRRMRPAAPGVSIGHYLTTAGTFGAVVYDRKSGQPLILSNNHVLANSSNGRDRRAKIGDLILQPGAIDGGSTSADGIARLKKYVALNEYPTRNHVDCALAQPLNNELIIPEILEIGLVRGTETAKIGMNVKKTGRTTGLTTGRIRAVNVELNVGYGRGRTLNFQNQILTTNMSAGGDSGSLVLEENNRAVGLLFAGSGQATLLNPIQTVLSLLDIEF